jgi:EAL domain-containing protein (putative c-di-GMP-specific phosphodiesterase class I)
MVESTEDISIKPYVGKEGMLSKDITAYFQPIIAVDSNQIYSYEVLGRYLDGSVTKSLGSFFSSSSSEEALEVDRIVRRIALKRFAEEGNGEYLFINLHLDWIAQYADRPEDLPTIKWANEFGVDLHKLVMEITEEEFYDDNDKFNKVIAYYKESGCRIAIDDFGKEASHIDRLAALSPDIIKIDMSYIHNSEDSYHYREYLKTLSFFAGKVGIEVLYEGIETQKQLDICISCGGRLYQGFILAKPQPSIKNAVANHDIFSVSTDRFIKSRQNDFSNATERYQFWDDKVERFLHENGLEILTEDIDDYLYKLCQWLPTHIKRAYICSRHGTQLSHNIEVDTHGIIWRDYRNKNWAWRGFFQEAMAMLDAGMKSYLTNAYRDVTTKEEMYTYVYQVLPDMYLFIDILKGEENDEQTADWTRSALGRGERQSLDATGLYERNRAGGRITCHVAADHGQSPAGTDLSYR